MNHRSSLAVAAAIIGFGMGAPVSADERSQTIHLIATSRHTTLLIPTASFDADLFSVPSGLTAYGYLDFGWGDEKWFRTEGRRRSALFTFRSTMIPTTSGIMIRGYNAVPATEGAVETVIALELSADGFRELQRFLAASLTRDESGSPILVDEFRDGQTRIYAGDSAYFYPKTCNTWTANALERAGIPLGGKRPMVSKKLIALVEQTR